MAKDFTKEDVIQNKKEAIKALNNMLERFINNPTGKYLKKAYLLSYWIKDYVRMINFEEDFVPTRNIAYKRGNIVKIDFGFNIGAEYGGLHYGIVLDNANAHNSPVVTVIPLTSFVDGKKIHPNSVDLGNELYRSLKIKYDVISKSLKREQEEIMDAKELFSALAELADEALEKQETSSIDDNSSNGLQNAQKYLDATRKIKQSWEEKEAHNKEQRGYLEKIGREISQMKEGSIALVNQITTVSKMRIFDPRNSKGVLANISLSKESMEKINEKVKEMYIF